jgi:arginyl-tRNA synthetase
MRGYLDTRVRSALRTVGLSDAVDIVFEKPKLAVHGDMTTNVALTLAKAVGRSPRLLAQEIAACLVREDPYLASVEVAGPGFINFRFKPSFFADRLAGLLAQGERFGRTSRGGGKKTQVEFVSANPTGPLSVGHGRQAAIGDTLANLLEWTGHQVTREYYYNNAGRQMRKLAESTFARYRQLLDPEAPFPDDGYQGEYIREIARALKEKHGTGLAARDSEEVLQLCKSFAEQWLFEDIKAVLKRMGVIFDVFFNEDSLYTSGAVEDVVKELRRLGLAYDQEGAVWFKATAFGLDKDRVIVKSTGEPTYRLPDIAYHREKFRRGFELIVDVFGADHIATIPDVLAGVKALGYDADRVKVVIHQFVTLLRNGEQVKMSKRAANFVTLDELLDEVGSDAVRFFFLMRSNSSHLEFDLNLAKEQSEKNPVYYLQYAHARIASILRFAASEGLGGEGTDLGSVEQSARLLQAPEEIDLLKLLLEFPDQVEGACTALEPHRIPVYLHDVATAFHRFYHEHRVVIPERDLARARLALCEATRRVLANGLSILGVSAPEKM